MKNNQIWVIFALMLSLTISQAQAVDLDDFVPADGEAVTTTLITNGAVTSDKIADSAITSSKIGTGVVTAGHIANDAITSDKIANGTITNSDIADNALDGSKISNGSLTGIDLANDTITATQIAADAVGASEIAAGAVGSSEIAANAIDASHIAADAVGSSEIVADAVGASEIAADAVGSSEIATDAVGAAEIAAGAVANSELAADAVTGDKILDGTITAADIAAGVISTTGTKYTQVGIGAGVRTSLTIGTVGSGYGAAPVLRYDNSNTSYSRWTMPIPDDYIAGTDMVVELLWTPSNTNAGNVVWQVNYASLAAGEVVPGSSGFTSKTYTQASPGTTLALTSTGNNITINAADIAADDVLNLVVLRDPAAVADTYTNDANVHLVKIKYQAKKVN